MKKLIYFLSVILLSSCASVAPQLTEFKIEPNPTEAGSKVRISWSVLDAEKVDISEVGNGLPSIGVEEIIAYESKKYRLIAYNGEKTIEKNIELVVNKKNKPEEVSIPIKESRNVTISKYATGYTNIETIKPKDKLSLNINILDYSESSKELKLYCTITDEYGNLVANLAPPYNNSTKANWQEVAEIVDGKKYDIKDFTVTEFRRENAPPISASLVLDCSGSMNEDYHFLYSAVQKAINNIKIEKDEYNVYQFDHRVFKSINSTSNPSDINNLFDFNELGGATAFYKASSYGINSLAGTSKEKIAILFTDGMDNASPFTNANDLVLAARKSNTKLFIIGFYRPYAGYSKNILESIANQTGGRTYFPSSISELDPIFEEIFKTFTSYYMITFKTKSENAKIKQVMVNLKLPNQSAEINSKRDYYTKSEKIVEDRVISVAWFAKGKDDISNEYNQTIMEIAEDLKNNPYKRIEIVAHTDMQGNSLINKNLSLRRAKKLAEKLISMGVNKDQIAKIIGKGKSEPLYPIENNEIEQQQNRRVEIKSI